MRGGKCRPMQYDFDLRRMQFVCFVTDAHQNSNGLDIYEAIIFFQFTMEIYL